MNPKIVGPDDEGQNVLPEAQGQKPNREEPSGTPQRATKAMLLDLDPFGHASLRRHEAFELGEPVLDNDEWGLVNCGAHAYRQQDALSIG